MESSVDALPTRPIGSTNEAEQIEADAQTESKMPDIKLAADTFKRILKHYGDDVDPSKMPEAHRTVLAVFHSHGVLGNGGFQFLFEGDLTGDPHFQLTREAYETIGADDSIAAFDKAYSVFPNSTPPKDMNQRLTIWQSNYNLADSVADDSSPDSLYFASMDDAMQNLKRYIESNSDRFSDL